MNKKQTRQKRTQLLEYYDKYSTHTYIVQIVAAAKSCAAAKARHVLIQLSDNFGTSQPKARKKKKHPCKP
jgi:hypothetical protein